MDPYAMVREMLGDIELSPGHRARLRALSTTYFSGLHALRQAEGAAEPSRAGAARPPDEAELAALEAGLASGIRELVADVRRAAGKTS